MPKQKQRTDRDLLARQAQQAAVQGLQDGADPYAMLDLVAFAHQPGHFTPDLALLQLAVSALDLASPAGLPPLAYEGLRERYLPEHPFSGRVEHRSSQYALYATACLRGGLEPDLLSDCGWWRTPLWQYAGYALVIYSRAAADRTHCDVAGIAQQLRIGHNL